MHERRILFAADIDDAIGYLDRHPLLSSRDVEVTVVWPGTLHKLNEQGLYSKLLLTARAGSLHSAYVASILPRVRPAVAS